MQFISLEAIKTDIDAALEKLGYVRAKVMCEKWDILPRQYANFICSNRDYNEDTFIVNGVRYVSKYAKSPAEFKKEREQQHE